MTSLTVVTARMFLCFHVRFIILLLSSDFNTRMYTQAFCVEPCLPGARVRVKRLVDMVGATSEGVVPRFPRVHIRPNIKS